MRIDDFQRWFRYDGWANGEALRSIQSSPVLLTRSVRLAAHIVGAEHLWHDRLLRRPSLTPVWPDFDLARSQEEVEPLKKMWLDYLAKMSNQELQREISYVNSKGEHYQSRIEDVLTHVITHGAYHRGQIAADVRANGSEPAYTDFIHAARQGLL